MSRLTRGLVLAALSYSARLDRHFRTPALGSAILIVFWRCGSSAAMVSRGAWATREVADPLGARRLHNPKWRDEVACISRHSQPASDAARFFSQNRLCNLSCCSSDIPLAFLRARAPFIGRQVVLAVLGACNSQKHFYLSIRYSEFDLMRVHTVNHRSSSLAYNSTSCARPRSHTLLHSMTLLSFCSQSAQTQMVEPCAFTLAGFVEIDPSGSHLQHALSGERVNIGDYVHDHVQGSLLLVFRNGVGVLYRNFEKIAYIADMFTKQYWMQDGWVYSSGGGPTEWLQTSAWVLVLKSWESTKEFAYSSVIHVPHAADITVKLWVLPLHTLGCKAWIECDALQGYTGPWAKKQHNSQNAYMLIEAWERASALLGFTPSLVCRKGSADKTDSFMRCLDSHCVSATGVLLALMHLSTRTRGEGKEEKKQVPRRLLEGLLQVSLVSNPCLYLEQRLGLVDVTSTIKETAVRIPVLDGIMQMHLCALQPLQLLLQKQATGFALDSITASDMLCALYSGGSGWRWAVSQILSQCGRNLDQALLSNLSRSSPLKSSPQTDKMALDEDSFLTLFSHPERLYEQRDFNTHSTLSKKCYRTQDVADMLAMGEASTTETPGERSVARGLDVEFAAVAEEPCRKKARTSNPGEIVRTAIKLGVVRPFSLQARWAGILRRYMRAIENSHGQAKRVAISCDASRFKIDTLMSVGGTLTEHGFSIAVLPPQVRGSSCLQMGIVRAQRGGVGVK
eukprot:6491349-Amphidinium_carterae.4